MVTTGSRALLVAAFDVDQPVELTELQPDGHAVERPVYVLEPRPQAREIQRAGEHQELPRREDVELLGARAPPRPCAWPGACREARARRARAPWTPAPGRAGP